MMSRRPVRWWLASCLLVTLVGPAGHADPVTVAPPFDNAMHASACNGYGLSTCSGDSSADIAGAFALSASVESPGGGSVPWLGYTSASARFERQGRLGRPVRAIEIVVTVHIDDALAALRSRNRDLGLPLDGYVSVFVEGLVQTENCLCSAFARRVVVAVAPGPVPTSLHDEEITLTLTVENHDSPLDPVAPGGLFLWLTVWGEASLQPTLATVPDAGEASFEIAGTVTRVTANLVE